MYARLAAGEFGCTIPQFFSVGEWTNHPDSERHAWWGVRSLTPGGPCRLNCPTDEVVDTACRFLDDDHRINISMMVDKVATVTAWLELWDSPIGLVVEGIEWPDTSGGWTWRNSMPDPARRKQWRGTVAQLVLRRHLNENSYADVTELLERYPDHVIELSTLNRCLGTVEHRNHVVWEIRQY